MSLFIPLQLNMEATVMLPRVGGLINNGGRQWFPNCASPALGFPRGTDGITEKKQVSGFPHSHACYHPVRATLLSSVLSARLEVGGFPQVRFHEKKAAVGEKHKALKGRSNRAEALVQTHSAVDWTVVPTSSTY